MQRTFSDIVADIDFIAHGSSYKNPATAMPDKILPRPGQIGITLEADHGQSANNPRARAAWLRRQRVLLDSLADEITRNALESCRALHLADANANVSALCEYRDTELRRLLAEVTSRGEQLKKRLARDRAPIDCDAGESELPTAAESARRDEALLSGDEIS